MENGKEIHSILEEDHKKKAKLKLTVKDALIKSKKEKVTLISREVPVDGKLLYGLIDEVHFIPNQIVIIDDKPNDYPYMSNKKQVWGYCLAFEECFKPELPIFATLRNRDSQKVFWQKMFNDEHRNIALESTQRILDILNGRRDPVPTSKSNKCMSCRLRNKCDMRNF